MFIILQNCDVSSGFMCGTTVVDKDGISAAVVTAEMTAYLVSQGTTVLQQLSHLHDKLVSFSSQTLPTVPEFWILVTFTFLYNLVTRTLVYLQSCYVLCILQYSYLSVC